VSAEQSLVLLAPLAGWSAPLEEVPDEVFSARMLGDGLAIDPTGDTLCAPCDAQVVVIPQAHHALTLRTPGGCEILLHVGLDTVALAGQGFSLRVALNETVRSGAALLTFDLDFLARHAKSVLTPVIISAESGYRIVRRSLDREVQVGDFLMEVAPLASQAAAPAGGGASDGRLTRELRVTLEHGLHARPAALLAAALKTLAADVRVAARGREANARSTTALMALGVQRGDGLKVSASGPDAAAALEALEGALRAAAAREATAAAAPRTRAVTPAAPTPAAASGELTGVIASGGLALGPAAHLRRPELEVAEAGGPNAQESAALDRARAAVRARLERRAHSSDGAPPAAREIAAAHLELLEDPELLSGARALIAQGKSAGFAWRQVIRAQARALGALDDARLRERVDDLLDLESQVLLSLAGLNASPAPQLPAGAIIIARDLLPSQLLGFEGGRVAGVCLAQGGATSHASILAAAMGIPALVALGPGILAVPDGTALVLDADHARVEIDPGAARLAQARELLGTRRAREVSEQAAAQQPCHTADGVRIEILANVGSLAEAEAAVRNGAEGCGLLRTEFLFLERQSPPTEAEQTLAYTRIAAALGARPLTIRTLDAGGDKPIAYLPLPAEENPALGLRGVRTSLAYPQLLRSQLRAVLATEGPGEIRLLLPMITEVADVQAVRAMLEELSGERPRAATLKVGVMIETPASAVLAAQLANVADFLSIGTNDLTQYTLAMDRTHPQLAARLDALHPAVLALIGQAAQAARGRGRHAAVCGGLASEVLAAPLLVGLGVQELSAVPAVIPKLKARIARVTSEACRTLAEQALRQQSAAAVRELLRAHEAGHA
jgi:phosphocarrier protein FPr/phosphocarrier protein